MRRFYVAAVGEVKTRSQHHRTRTHGIFKSPSASASEPPMFCWETSPSHLPTFVDVVYLDTFQARLLTGLPVVLCPARLQSAFENMMKALTRPSKPPPPSSARAFTKEIQNRGRNGGLNLRSERHKRDAKPASWCREP